ncbi:MAG: metal-dependent transcriptional regulator [Verrucomicrobiae bacterium]|nr:metal-dependent transcriptional regulator [Verrucomicrobiae bacterium]
MNRRLELDLSKSDQIIAEDILKVLFQIEYDKKQGDLDLISARIGHSREVLLKIIPSLIEKGYLKREQDVYHLTEEGERFALLLLRAHRICETYLAKETGLPAGEWHVRAHEMEHKLSFGEINDLSDKLGNPRFDPHGDPIPTRDGKILEIIGTPLPDWEKGKPAVILHVEDEPEISYKKLASANIFPGVKVKIIDKSSTIIDLLVEGMPVRIDVCDALLVSVTDVPPELEETEDVHRLSELECGESATIRGLLPSCMGLERLRLLDLGIVNGSRITCEFKSVLGSPISYRVRGTLIALRKEQADRILIMKNVGKSTN